MKSPPEKAAPSSTTKRKSKSKKAKSKPFAIYPHLCASIGLEFLEEEDKEALKTLKGGFKHNLEPHCTVVPRRGFLLENLGENYSPEYQELVLGHLPTPKLKDFVRAAQKSGIHQILFEKEGGFPEPRVPAKTRWEDLPTKLSPKKWKELKESLRSLEELWPLELLANILNPLIPQKGKK